MPIKLEMAIREGWKATENDRFGEVIELRFIDGDKIMFRYAPKLEDEQTSKDAFVFLREYDVRLKNLRTLISSIDGRVNKLGGCVCPTDVK